MAARAKARRGTGHEEPPSPLPPEDDTPAETILADQ